MLLNTLQQLNLLDLYDEEIKSRIARNFSKLGILEALVHKGRIKEILEQNVGDTTSIGNKLWIEFRNSALNNTLYNRVLIFLRDVDRDLHAMIYVEEYRSEFILGFSKLLMHSASLLTLMDPIARILTNIISITGHENLVKPLYLNFLADTFSEIRVKKIILRYIPLLTVYGYEHLLYAILLCNKEAEKFITKIYPNFFNKYEYLKQTASNPHGLFHIINTTESIADRVMEAFSKGILSKKVLCTRIGRIPLVYERACVIDICKETPLNLRNYQIELVNDACRGHNVVICAPTGSGKTVVGTYIVRNHIYQAIANQRRFKICYIVPTAALVEQQQKLLQKYLAHCTNKICCVCGNLITNIPNRHAIEQADISIVTPQTLVNLLTEKSVKLVDEIFEPFYLSIFTMLVFDEAHHANERHPYNEVLNHYHDMMATRCYNNNMPQIIGMTASLGIGGSSAKDLQNAILFTLSMCANLDAHYISRVRTNLDELKAYTSDINDSIEFVNLSDFYSQNFNRILHDVVQYFESRLLNSLKATGSSLLKMIEEKPDFFSNTYENWLCKVELELSLNSALLTELRQFLIHYIDQLKIFFFAYTLLKLFGSKALLDYVETMETKFFITKQHEDVIYLKDKISLMKAESAYKSELLVKLFRILHEQFTRDANSRVLIFVMRRDYCRRLAQILDDELSVGADFLTGQTSVDQGGTRLMDIKKKLSDFAEGRKKILCVTSVAEEGIDISECNLVIEYNNVSGDIARIQRRGRGRAKNARSILLTLDKEIQQRSEQNAIREKLMMDALNEVDKRPNHWFREEIDKIIAENREARLSAKALKEEERNRYSDSCFKYSIHCRKCDCFLVWSNKICTIEESIYTIVDKDFWSRVSIGPLPSSVDDKLIIMGTPHIGEFFCSNGITLGICGNRIGRIIFYNDVRLPTINCKSIVFIQTRKACNVIEENSHRYLLSKWKKVCEKLFYPSYITALNLKEMKLAEELISSKLVSVMEAFQRRRETAIHRCGHHFDQDHKIRNRIRLFSD